MADGPEEWPELSQEELRRDLLDITAMSARDVLPAEDVPLPDLKTVLAAPDDVSALLRLPNLMDAAHADLTALQLLAAAAQLSNAVRIACVASAVRRKGGRGKGGKGAVTDTRALCAGEVDVSVCYRLCTCVCVCACDAPAYLSHLPCTAFGPAELAFVCDCCDGSFCEEATTATHAQAFPGQSVQKPRRYCSSCIDAIQDAESALEAAMAPDTGVNSAVSPRDTSDAAGVLAGLFGQAAVPEFGEGAELPPDREDALAEVRPPHPTRSSRMLKFFFFFVLSSFGPVLIQTTRVGPFHLRRWTVSARWVPT